MNRLIFNPKVDTSSDRFRKAFWPIWFPLILTLALILGLMILTILSGGNGPALQKWSSISLVLMILPNLVIGLTLLALTVLIVYGLGKLSGKMPGWMKNAQAWVFVACVKIQNFADSLVKPAIKVNQVAYQTRKAPSIIKNGWKKSANSPQNNS